MKKLKTIVALGLVVCGLANYSTPVMAGANACAPDHLNRYTKSVITLQNWTTTHVYGNNQTCTMYCTGNKEYRYCRDCEQCVEILYFEKQKHVNCGLGIQTLYQ